MTDEQRDLLDRLFEEAVALAPDRRRAFLALNCTDPDVLRELESLLEFASAGGELIETAIGAMAQMVQESQSSSDYSGRKLGAFRVLGPIAKGGMGEVYRGTREDSEFEQVVAIKFLRPDMDNNHVIHRFRQERQILARMAHPNIARIIDGGTTAEGLPYFVMEYIEGEPITLYAQRLKLSLSARLSMFLTVCDAVDYAHQKSIIHRDIKPSNILVTEEGITKLLDFGVAKRTVKLDSPNTLTLAKTVPGLVIGSYHYMSPEQAVGDPVDARSDVFSLGVVLYELVTGERPFNGTSPNDVIAEVLDKEPGSITKIAPRVPREVSAIIGRALKKKREDRYQTVGEMHAELKKVLQSLEYRGPLGGARKWIATAAVAVLSVIAAYGVYSWRIAESDRPISFENVRMDRLTNTGLARIGELSPDGRYVAFVENRRSIWLRPVAAAAATQIVPEVPGMVSGLRFSPDGNFLYYLSGPRGGDGSLYRVPVLGGVSRKLIDGVGGMAVLTPDGERMIFVQSNGDSTAIVVVDPDGNNPRDLYRLARKDGLIGSVAWIAESNRVAFSLRNLDPVYYTVHSIPIVGGSPEPVSGNHFARILDLAWLPGRGLLVNALDRSIGTYQIFIAGPRSVHRITNDLNEYVHLSVSKAGELATSQVISTSNMWVVEGSAVPKQITRGSADYEGMSWTPDGRIISAVRNGRTQELWLQNADGSGARQIFSADSALFSPAVCPDAKSVLFSWDRDGNMSLWRMDLAGGQPVQLTKGLTDTYPNCSPDGKSLTFLSRASGKSAVWRMPVAGGVPEHIVDSMDVEPSLSPDGSRIAFSHQASTTQEPAIAIQSLEGGPPSVLGYYSRNFRWTADSGGLFFLLATDGQADIWMKPLADGAAKRITDLRLGEIRSFAVSPDGRKFVVDKLSQTGDIVLFRGLH